MKKHSRLYYFLRASIILFVILVIFTNAEVSPQINPTPSPSPTSTPTAMPTPLPRSTHTPSHTPTPHIREDIINIVVPYLFNYPVHQQPLDNPAFVAERSNVVTQFRLVAQNNCIGILAHNYLAGGSFIQLELGDVIQLFYADGAAETYQITETLSFQALQPFSVYSDFVDLETSQRYTVDELFDLIYNRPGHLVLQTSIEAEGTYAWGRLFIIAERR